MQPCLNAPISSVTVFANGALITRAGDLGALPDTPVRLRIPGLPLCLDDDTVRVRIEDSDVIATEVAVILEVPPEDTVPAQKDDHQREVAEQAVMTASRRLEWVKARIAHLGLMEPGERPKARWQDGPLPSLHASRLALVGFRSEEQQRLTKEQRRLEKALRSAQDHRDDLIQRENLASQDRKPRLLELRKTAVVSLLWQGTRKGRLVIEYQVPGATWTPNYTIRFDMAMASATVEMRASVRQNSGEDWQGVRMMLSSAGPVGWQALPELTSLRIGRRQLAPSLRGWRPAPVGADALFGDFDHFVEAGIAVHESCAVSFCLGEAEEEPSRRKDEHGKRSGAKSSKRARPDSNNLGAVPVGAPPAAPPPPAPVAASAPMAGREMVRSTRRSVGSQSAYRISEGMADYQASKNDEFVIGSALGQPADEPKPEPVYAPAKEFLRFGRLRMLPPGHDGRGVPQPISNEERWRIETVSERIHVEHAVERVVTYAIQQAASVATQVLPPRCSRIVPGRFAHAYPVASPIDIPSDGVWHGLPVGTASSAVTIHHVVVPREAREVFRMSVITNAGDAPWPTGPADVFIGDTFLLGTELSQTPAGGTVRLGLGVEQGITVARRASFQESAAGMLGGSLALLHQVDVTIANKLQRPVTLEVRERLPVQAEGVDDCKVKIGEVRPAWEEWRPDEDKTLKGGHRWNITLAAGASTELHLAFTITIPAKNELVGGNRRET